MAVRAGGLRQEKIALAPPCYALDSMKPNTQGVPKARIFPMSNDLPAARPPDYRRLGYGKTGYGRL
jgi:hypothetical protein